MTEAGKFTADHAALWKDGNITLRGKAVDFANLCQTIHKTAQHQQEAFAEAQTDIGAKWGELRDLLQLLCGATADNLDSTGLALKTAAENFAATDSANGKSIEGSALDIKIKEWLGNDDGHKPPNVIPERPKPGDPPVPKDIRDLPPAPGDNRPH